MTGVCGEVVALDWASAFFARKCARLDLDGGAAPLTAAALDAFDIVEAKVSVTRQDLVDALRGLGFRPVEGEVGLVFPVSEVDGAAEHVRAGAADVPALRAISRGVFCISRFRPPWYSEEQRDRFYQQWVENAVYGTHDDECLLLREDDDITGYVTVRAVGPGSARIGLLAAAPRHTGRGVGGRLVSAARRWCAERGMHSLAVATQAANHAALRSYQAHGGVVSTRSHWMYR